MIWVDLMNDHAYQICVSTRASHLISERRAAWLLLSCLISTLVMSACNGGVESNPDAKVGYELAGLLTGLPAGQEIILRNGENSTLTVAANGRFAFSERLNLGSSFFVSVVAQPPLATCRVEGGVGVVAGDVSNVSVSCKPNPTVSGTVAGLRPGTQLTLVNNLDFERPVVVREDGPFTFERRIPVGAGYSVSVEVQPVGVSCVVASGVGLALSDVSSVAVTCSTPSDRFAYVVDYGASRLSSFRLDPATGGLGSAGIALTGLRPTSVAVDPGGRYIYTTDGNDDTISTFSIDAGSGAAVPTGLKVATGRSPSAIAIHPGGRFAYVLNQIGNSVSVYRVGALDGSLTSIGIPARTGMSPFRLSIAPSGQYAYVANVADSSVSVFSINPVTGELTPAGPDVPIPGSPSSIAIEPAGRFAYISQRDAQSVLVMGVEAATGRLVATGQQSAAERAPYMVAIEPLGRFAYVVNNIDDSVVSYAIDSITGALSRVGSPTSSGRGPVSLSVSLNGRFVFVINDGDHSISTFAIDPRDGTLSVARPPMSVGSLPIQIVTTAGPR